MKRGHKRGFTIVELMIVIVVIGILSSITAVMYTGAQTQSRNTQIIDIADKVVDSIKLFAVQQGHFPRGGSGSSAAIGAGTECADGSTGWYSTGYLCHVNDTLVASNYLPSSVAAGIPSGYGMMVYTYGTNQAMVFYTLQNPSATDTAKFNAQMTKCGLNPGGTVAQRDTNGMRGGICFDY